MPSFDIVSEVDRHELANAVDQANREVSTRFDLKDTSAQFEMAGEQINIIAEGEFQAKQLADIFRGKLVKRHIDVNCMELDTPETSGKTVKQAIIIREGIEQALSKKIIKLIKDAKLKVQTSIQGDKLRVTGKKRDDLQAVISLVKESSLDWPLQYNNFRD